MTEYPTPVKEMLKLEDVPLVQINQEGIFTFINSAFTTKYGWTESDLLGKSVVEIMPKHMRSAHKVGFLISSLPKHLSCWASHYL